jgi:hypothetical protein
MNKTNKTLLQEALQIDYRLRSTFFYRKLYDLGFQDLLNKIGDEAELIIKKFLIRSLLEHNYITSIIFKNGSSSRKIENLIEQVEQISGIRLNNQTSILFSPEPDVSFLDADGQSIAVMEIKGGKDAAGALERYGAARKSFEEAKRLSQDVITIFVASCITDEVNKRLAQDQLINYTYNLTQLVSNENIRASFIANVLELVKIVIE